MLYFEGVKTLIDIITGEVAFSTTVFAVVMIAGTLLLFWGTAASRQVKK